MFGLRQQEHAVGFLVLLLLPTPSAAQGLSWRNHQDPGIQSALGHQSDYPLVILRRFCGCVICSAGSDKPRRFEEKDFSVHRIDPNQRQRIKNCLGPWRSYRRL